MNEEQSRTLPRAWLRWQSLDGDEQELLLEKAVTIIGRGRDNEVVILDTSMSRRHTEVRYESGAFHIRDLRSVNGTFVNGKRIESSLLLKNDDLIQAGSIKFKFAFPDVEEALPEKMKAEAEIPERQTIVIPELSKLPHLEISSGTQRGVSFDLVKEKTVIGRSGRGKQWDISLSDRAVSRPQAQVTREGDNFILVDLDSANGTLLNGEMLSEPHFLKDGDAVTFGEMVLIFRSGEVGTP